MTEFLVATEIVTTDATVTPTFMRAAKTVEKFGRTAEKSFDRASRASREFSKDTIRGMDKIQNRIAGFRGVTGGILGADIIREGFRGATLAVGGFISEAAKVESAELVFKRFAGGVREGKKMVADLRQLAARTPFEFTGLADVSKLLLSMGGATRDDLIPTLIMLGNVAGGNQDRFNRLAFAFGEVASNTKASFQEIRQFTNAQVPIFKQLIKQWGVTPAVARKMVKAGKATFPEILKGFKAMTSEGGMFFNAMREASEIFEGRMSTLRDNIKLTAATIGLQFLPTLTRFVEKGIRIAQITAEWAENNKELIKTEFTKWLKTTEQILTDLWPIAKAVFKTVSFMLPVIRELSPILPVLAAGWLANKLALKGLALVETVGALIKMTKAIKGATFAQWMFNVAAFANPYGVIITGIIVGLTAVTAAIVLIVKNWDFLVEKTRRGTMSILTFFKELSFGLFRVFFLPITKSIQGTAWLISKIGGALGLEKVEREFGGIVTQMDNLDHRMTVAAGQFGKIIAKGEEFRQVFQKDLSFKVKPIAVDYFINERRKIEAGALPSPLAALPRPAFQFDGGDPIGLSREADRGKRPTEEAAGPTLSAGLFKELKIRLDITGAPEGSKVTTDGALAPLIDINLLGAN